ncbi:MAG: DUF934 domain-containing protein [Burkholderiales bacterium]|nr:DUF934 domain-containing protein [Burkholderiales bacterium]
MTRLIGRNAVSPQEWKIVANSAGIPAGPVLVPVSLWKARRFELVQREYEHGWSFGVWLKEEDSIREIEQDVHDFAAIAIEFDRYGDGKGFEIARKLRRVLGFTGELRAIGDIGQADIVSLKVAGFDSFGLRQEERLAIAV